MHINLNGNLTNLMVTSILTLRVTKDRKKVTKC